MNSKIEEKLALISELVKKREDIEQKLEVLLGFSEQSKKKSNKIQRKIPNYITGENTNLMKDPKIDLRSKENKKNRIIITEPLEKLKGNWNPNRINDETKQEIINALENAETIPDIAMKFGVSRGTIYNIRKQSGLEDRMAENSIQTIKTPEKTYSKTINEYQCENNHLFKSNLPPGEPICPTCGSHEINLFVPQPVTEEDLYGGHSNFNLKGL
jgi:hypothetical protein